MPEGKSELMIDDGTQFTSLKIRCKECEDEPYLLPGPPNTIETPEVKASEYAFTCPTQGCTTGVVLRLHHDAPA